MWVPYSLAARLLVREVPLERRVLVPHAPELAFFAVRGRRRGPAEIGREARIARLGALEVVSRARRRRGASRAWLRQVATRRRRRARTLAAQNNIASTYENLGRNEEALSLRRQVYSGRLKLNGEENEATIRAVYNYAYSLIILERFEEAKALLLKAMPIARRVLGDNDRLTLKLRCNYAVVLYKADGATLDDLREAVTTLEDSDRIARRVFGGAHPFSVSSEHYLRNARAMLRAREGA